MILIEGNISQSKIPETSQFLFKSTNIALLIQKVYFAIKYTKTKNIFIKSIGKLTAIIKPSWTSEVLYKFYFNCLSCSMSFKFLLTLQPYSAIIRLSHRSRERYSIVLNRPCSSLTSPQSRGNLSRWLCKKMNFAFSLTPCSFWPGNCVGKFVYQVSKRCPSELFQVIHRIKKFLIFYEFPDVKVKPFSWFSSCTME